MEFTSLVAQLAISQGLIPSNVGEFNGLVTTDQSSLIIRAHGTSYTFSLRDVAVKNVESSTPVYTYTNSWEVDAIIAETMLNPATRSLIYNNYPEIWNLMLSREGFFNPEYFQPVPTSN